MARFLTEGGARWSAAFTGPERERWIGRALRRGRDCLRPVVVGREALESDDLAFLAYECWRGMRELRHSAGGLEGDYYVAGEVLDEWVSDRDAELLAYTIRDVAAQMQAPVGGMTAEVAGVHLVLLHVVGALREQWEARANGGGEPDPQRP